MRSENSLRNLESYKQHSPSLIAKLMLFVALFVFVLSPLLTDEALAGCCLSPESGLGVYCTSLESGCSNNGYDPDSSCPVDDCTIGCCCYEHNTPYNYKTVPKGYCIYKNETEEVNIGELRFTSKEEAFVDDIDSCAEFCSNQQITGSISEETLLYFRAEHVEGQPRQVKVSWRLNQSINEELFSILIYYCEIDDDSVDENNPQCEVLQYYVADDSPEIISGLEPKTCYKFYLDVIDLESFEENYSIICTGDDECHEKKWNQLFDLNGYCSRCNRENKLQNLGIECKDDPEGYCNSKMGHLGMMNQSNCNEDYVCFLDKHPSGLYSCYNCPVESGMECYDYKSKEACESDSCKIGNCSWNSLGFVNGIDIGVCVSTEESNCDNCGSLFSSSADPDFYQSGNEFLYLDCTQEILSLLGSAEEECTLDPLCYTGDLEETCLDYETDDSCEKNTCNVGGGANCIWDYNINKCGRDLDRNDVRDCSGLSGENLTKCELDFYPPTSNLKESGSVDDLHNYKLKIEIWDRRNESDSMRLISLLEGDSIRLCSPPDSSSNFDPCDSSSPSLTNGEILGSEFLESGEIYVKDLISEGKLSVGKVNTFNYFAFDKNRNIEPEMNYITIDLRDLDGCTEDISCFEECTDESSCPYKGVCEDVKRICDNGLGVFLNTCEAALDEFKENDDSYEDEEKSCDGLDNDCDGETDEGLTQVYYYDDDEDKVGNMTNNKTFCIGKPDKNYVDKVKDDSGKVVWDCDDSNALISPLLEEDCDDEIDNNCNDLIDGYDNFACHETECNCKDDDEDGIIDEGCPDFDNDTYIEDNGVFELICDCVGKNDCVCGPDSCDFDIDGDGIKNHIDKNNHTPLECYPVKNDYESNKEYITANGTAKDEDFDGVCDFADRCDGTPQGCSVFDDLKSNTAGCPKVCDGPCLADDSCSCESCESCGGGDWQSCTALKCSYCGENCAFEEMTAGYGYCVECAGEVHTCYYDRDKDKFVSMSDNATFCNDSDPPNGCIVVASDYEDWDCNDSDASIYPRAKEEYNDIDDDCDGEVDEGLTKIYYLDKDEDGIGIEIVNTTSSSQPKGYVPKKTIDGKVVWDCNDSNKDIYPGAKEICDGLDNDCDDEIDEDLTQVYYYDGDKDGVGKSETNNKQFCIGKNPENYTEKAYNDFGMIVWDCDDSNALISPLLEEDCDDGIDNNCNDKIDEFDADCIEKGEQCNNCEDDDKDGLINEGCPDFDEDTYKEVNGAFQLICKKDNKKCDFCSEVCLCGPDKFDLDKDGDGIINDLDNEEETPLECHPEKNVWSAIYITEDGIAKDKDSDGVCDYADKCEDTVSGCPVELNLSSYNAGCPKSCADTKCWTDYYCSKCDGNCEACGGGNWQLCTKEVCESCSEDCIFTLVKEVNGIKYGNCTTCVGEECEELKGNCSDGIKNNEETDVDCGGPVCLPCDVGKSCKYHSDCKDDLICDDSECVEPPEEDTCNNKKWDPRETDVDCGGICLKKCDIGQKCNKDDDCLSGICSDDKICVSVDPCENGKTDGTETDEDCGGKCAKCENGKKCNEDSDCKSDYCKDGICKPYEEKDSDGDGMPDYWEMEHGTNPSKADADDDADEEGLTNYKEYQFYINGTKILPYKADTDGDGATDKEEIDKGTDPTDPNDKPSNAAPLVLILIALLIFLGILLYLFFNGSKNSKTKKPKMPQNEKINEHPKIQISSIDNKQKTKEKDNFELKDKEIFKEFESDIKKKVSKESSVEPKKIMPSPKFTYAPKEKEAETEKVKTDTTHEKSKKDKVESKEGESIEKELNKVLQPSKKTTKVYEEIKKESSSDEIDNLIKTLEEGVLKNEFDETKRKTSSSALKGRKSKSRSATSKTSNKSKGEKTKKSSKK
ncbi:MAG: hypothetical protein PWR30_245 [Candidatus Woesearchaeota archaeon]|nr:hypothetical protein [Candidatus Woesearchaeota archaeon]